MNKENSRLLFVGLAAFVAVLAYHQGPQLVSMSAGKPSQDQIAAILATVGAVIAAIKGWKGDGGGGGAVPTIDLLQSIKTIVEQFKAKGMPDSVDMTLSWGGENYELKWAKRVKPEPK